MWTAHHRHLPFLVLFVTTWMVADCRQAAGQAIAVELVTSEDPVPDWFESWSLFLVCNPAWVLPESSARIDSLYARFRAFGDALGPRHVAVWFWTREDRGDRRTAVDVVRSSAYCERFGLRPSEGPYVVVTAEYPGAGLVPSFPETFDVPENRSVVSLNELDAAEITRILTRLADQVVIEGLPEEDVRTETFWRAWQRSFQAVRTGMVEVADRIRVTINTSFFSVEIGPR